jgi:hypothetical protein
MKKTSIYFLQAVIILVACLALFLLIRMPLTEGRAVNLDLFHIYSDPFILYGYVASIPFFIALYKGFKLLGYIGQGSLFSLSSVEALKSIKLCAIVFSIFILGAGVFIKLFHSKEDDPAGFIALCILITFLSAIVATTANVFEKNLRKAIDMKSENDLTI